MGREVLVIGVGNDYRCDDAVGLIVARRAKERAPEGVTVLEESGEGTALLDRWRDASAVILIDAVHSGSPPGTVHRLEAHEGKISGELFCLSTHAVSIAKAIELAKALHQLPSRVVVYGVEGKRFRAGAGLSAEVEAAADQTLDRVMDEVSDIAGAERHA